MYISIHSNLGLEGSIEIRWKWSLQIIIFRYQTPQTPEDSKTSSEAKQVLCGWRIHLQHCHMSSKLLFMKMSASSQFLPKKGGSDHMSPSG